MQGLSCPLDDPEAVTCTALVQYCTATLQLVRVLQRCILNAPGMSRVLQLKVYSTRSYMRRKLPGG